MQSIVSVCLPLLLLSMLSCSLSPLPDAVCMSSQVVCRQMESESRVTEHTAILLQ